MEIKDLYNDSKLGIKNNELFEVLYNFSNWLLDNQDGTFMCWDDLTECLDAHDLNVVEAYLSAGGAIYGVNCFDGGRTEAMNDITNEVNRIVALLATERGWEMFDYGDGSVAYVDPNIEED